MKIRTISGAGFVALVVGFFLLREYVDYRLFDILIWFFGAVGTYEVARAVKPFTSRGALVVAVAFGIIYAPIYFVTECFLWVGYGWLVAIGLTIVCSAIVYFAPRDGLDA